MPPEPAPRAVIAFAASTRPQAACRVGRTRVSTIEGPAYPSWWQRPPTTKRERPLGVTLCPPRAVSRRPCGSVQRPPISASAPLFAPVSFRFATMVAPPRSASRKGAPSS